METHFMQKKKKKLGQKARKDYIPMFISQYSSSEHADIYPRNAPIYSCLPGSVPINKLWSNAELWSTPYPWKWPSLLQFHALWLRSSCIKPSTITKFFSVCNVFYLPQCCAVIFKFVLPHTSFQLNTFWP